MASSSSSSNARPARVERSPESFLSLQTRNQAVEILQSYEKLSWASYARRESLQQTRLHYQNVVAGFSAADEARLVDWPTDNTPLPNRDGDDERSARRKQGGTSKGKERVNGVAAQDASSSTLPASDREKMRDSTRSSESKLKKRKS